MFVIATADGTVVSSTDETIVAGTCVTARWPEHASALRTALSRSARGEGIETLPVVADQRAGHRWRLTVHPLFSDRSRVDTLLVSVEADDTREQTSSSSGAFPDTQLREMSGVLAHEIRNPLAGVRAAIELVARRLPGGVSDAAVVEQVLARIDALDALLEELLLFSESPHPSLEPVDVELVVGELIATFNASHGSRLRLSSSGGLPRVNADATLLNIALTNLLMNALQADASGAQIDVGLESSDAAVLISIQDHGPGLSAAAEDALFRPFFTTKARGTGLGLPMARRLVELHGGQLSIDSTPVGARVVVMLPAAQLQALKVSRHCAN